jgi:signal recognition particle GTPase
VSPHEGPLKIDLDEWDNQGGKEEEEEEEEIENTNDNNNNNNKNTENKKSGSLFGFLKTWTSAKVFFFFCKIFFFKFFFLLPKPLESTDLAPILQNFKDHLISKNVASEIADKLCESVGSSLVGKTLGTFQSNFQKIFLPQKCFFLNKILFRYQKYS